MRVRYWILLAAVLLMACGPATVGAPTAAPDTATPPQPTATAVPTGLPTPTAQPSPRPTATAAPTRAPRPTAAPGPTEPPVAIGPFQPLPANEGRPAGNVNRLTVAPDGNLWLATMEGMAIFQDGTWTPLPAESGGVFAGFDGAGRPWMAHIEEHLDITSVSLWDGTSWTTYGAEAGWTPAGFGYYFSDRVFSEEIVVDRRGWAWLATGDDVRVFDGQRWTLYGAEEIGFTLTREMIEGGYDYFWLGEVAIDSSGDVWVADCAWMGPGPRGHGARWFTGEAWQGQDSPVVASGCIYDIEVDDTGGIWAGVDGNLWRYALGQGWEEYAHPPTDPGGELRWGFLEAIDLDPAGVPWVTLHRCGGGSCDTEQYALFRIADGTWTHVLEIQGYGRPDLAFDAAGDVWACTGAGLYHITPETAEPLGGEENAYCQVEVDGAGRVWLALPGKSTLWLYER